MLMVSHAAALNHEAILGRAAEAQEEPSREGLQKDGQPPDQTQQSKVFFCFGFAAVVCLVVEVTISDWKLPEATELCFDKCWHSCVWLVLGVQGRRGLTHQN